MVKLSKMVLGLAVALLHAVPLVSARADETPLSITNFKFGLVCGDPGNRRVCFQTSTIQVTNESRCVFNQKEILCTWYGFSFDYDAAADVKIDCGAFTDAVLAFGNPKELLKPADKVEFGLALKQGKHHFFVAQYIGGENGEGHPNQARETCSLAGKQLFSAEYHYEFADKTEPVESVPDMSGRK